jgi:hypothetical protein
VFSTPANNMVYKSMCLQFRGGLTNNEHKSLSWFRPLLGGNSHTSSGLILMKMSVIKGEQSAQVVHM